MGLGSGEFLGKVGGEVGRVAKKDTREKREGIPELTGVKKDTREVNGNIAIFFGGTKMLPVEEKRVK